MSRNMSAAELAARLGDLRRTLKPLSFYEERFVRWATQRVAPRPPNYVEIAAVNLGRTGLPLFELRQLELGPDRSSVSA